MVDGQSAGLVPGIFPWRHDRFHQVGRQLGWKWLLFTVVTGVTLCVMDGGIGQVLLL